MKEEFKNIPGYEGIYQISNIGRVKSLKSGRRGNEVKILNNQDNGFGYKFIILKKIKQKRFYIHRLILIAFIGEPKKGYQVNHKNGIKSDNSLNNLEWVTPSQNQKHRYEILGHKGSMVGKFGKLHHNSKKVNQYTKEGEFIKTWDYMRLIRKELGIPEGNISMCCNGKLKTAGGFIWKF